MGKFEATGKWEKVRTKKTVQCGKHYQVDMDKVVTPGGKLGVYWVVRTKPFAMVVPQDEKGNLHMVRQHRYPLGQFTIEFPAGGSDGQNPLKAAKRELEEEMGLRSDQWTKMGTIFKGSGIADSTGYLYLAQNAREILHPILDPSDKGLIEKVEYSVEKVRKMILDGKINDSGTIAAFCRAEMMGLFR